jgi:hypothetical protein
MKWRMSTLWLAAFLIGAASAPCSAVVQGAANASTLAAAREVRGDYASAALWRAAAVDTLERVSVPMSREIQQFYRRYQDPVRLRFALKAHRTDVAEGLAINRRLLQQDLAAARKSGKTAVTPGEREQAADLCLKWILAYPDRFFRFGLYMGMADRAEREVAQGRPAVAVEIEAEAREICARQYREVLVRYLRDKVAQFRKESKQSVAERYSLLAVHYERLAAQQVTEAAELRRHRALLAQAFANPTGPAAASPAFRRVMHLRNAQLRRTAAAIPALASSDPRARFAALRQFIRTRQGGALLRTLSSGDDSLRTIAANSLDGGLARADAALTLSVIDTLRTSAHIDLQEAHRALLRATGRPSRIPATFPAAQDESVRSEWLSWWTSALRPGIDVTYYQDPGCHLPLLQQPEVGISGSGLSQLSEARAARWDAIVDVRQDNLYLVSLRRDGAVRLWVDGVQQSLTAGGSSPRLARLELPRGQHALRLEYAPATGTPLSRRGPELRFHPLTLGAGPLRFQRYDPRGTTLRPTQVVRGGTLQPL